MTSWDIYPPGVRGVLDKTATAAEDMGKAGKSIQETLPKAAASAGTISGPYCGNAPVGPVAAALSEYFKGWERDLLYVAKRTGNSVNGAIEATNEYLKGDVKMAENKQREAIKEPVIEMPGQSRCRPGEGPK
ncbi:DUF6507 family protein [Streptomyces klenkii]|uniref:DUF6507 family protein n=1 Tax=Streptomyces klenkii TaxID=1420899 RepID=UPI0033BA3445